MPIFSKPKSASLNPDRLANKEVYERDKERVNTGTPSATSKVDAESFETLIDTLDELRNELIKVQTAFDTQQATAKFDYGNILNIFSKAIRQSRSVSSNRITTFELNKLQESTNLISEFYQQIDAIQEQINVTLNALPAMRAELGEEVFNKRVRFAGNLLTFYKNIVSPFKTLLTLLNTKLVSSGNDINPNLPIEISGINAEQLQGAGFKTSWKLENGAEQYQNQKYI